MARESDVRSIVDLEKKLAETEIIWDAISSSAVYRWLSTLAKSRGTTAELLLCSALASTSAMLGRTTVKLFQNFHEYQNLFLIALSPSGSGKTPACMTGAVRPIVNHVEEKARVSVLVDDTTCNGLFNFYNTKNKVTPLLCVDEAYPLLKSVAKPTKTHGQTSLSMERLCKLYDGDYWYCVKGNKGARHGVPSARLSLLAFTTPKLFLADVWPKIIEARNGLADRILLFYQSKKYLELEEIEGASIQLEELFALKSFDTVFEQIYAEHNGEDVIEYGLSVDAKDAFFRYSKKESGTDENQQQSASTSTDSESSSKKVKNGLKLALVMHVLYDRLEKGLNQELGPTERSISEETLEMALALNETLHTCKGVSELVRFFKFLIYV